jgi:type VI secretion system secreted protein VgrG
MAVNVEIKIGDVTLRNREIEHLEITQELGEHHRLSITFHRDLSKPLKLSDFVNPKVVVTLTDDVTKVTATPFVGLIDSAEEQHQLRGGSIFVMAALSDSAKFSARHHKGNLLSGSITDIMSRFEIKVVGTPPFRRLQDWRQAGESDFAFLKRVADDHQCYLRPVEGGLELRHGFDDLKHDLTWGKNLDALTSRMVPRNARYKGAYYEFQSKAEIAFADRQKDAVATGATNLTDAVKNKARELQVAGTGNIYETITRSALLSTFRDAVIREAERRSGAAVTVDGRSTNIELLVGDTVDIHDGVNHKLANPVGTLGLTHVKHLFDGNQYTNTFVATPWANFSNAEQPPRQTLFGLTTAEVVENLDPAGLGRIKIRLKDNAQGSPELDMFARYVTPFAGNGRGIAFLPEIGDEVIVGFEEGDPEHPYIIGSVWNGADKSPGPTPKRIVTKSGNAIVMDDAGMIEIHSPSGTCLVQLSNGVDGAPRITIASGGDLFLEAADRIQLKCKNLVELVDKDATRIIKGDDRTSVQGSRFSTITGEDIYESDTRIAFLAGGASTIDMTPIAIVSQGSQIVSIAKAQNVVQGLFVLLNPPGLVMPPAQGGIFVEPEKKDSVATGRENPKATQPFKTTREES